MLSSACTPGKTFPKRPVRKCEHKTQANGCRWQRGRGMGGRAGGCSGLAVLQCSRRGGERTRISLYVPFLNKKATGRLFVFKSQVTSKINLVTYKKVRILRIKVTCPLKQNAHTPSCKSCNSGHQEQNLRDTLLHSVQDSRLPTWTMGAELAK